MSPDAADSKARSVIVLGSPRTGTSLTASVLRELGYHVDAGLNDRFNERGYWEDFYVLTVNDVILNRFGGVLENPPRLPEGWEESGFVRKLDDEALGIIAKAKQHESWALKDPRFSLTLPFWKRFLPPDTVFIVCLRRPDLAAMSMNRSFGMNLETAAKLWSFYTTQALRNTEGKRRLLIDYDDYFGDFSGVWTQIKSVLRAPDTRALPKIVPAMRHFAGPSNARPDVPAAATRLYERLRENPSTNLDESRHEYSFTCSGKSVRSHSLLASLGVSLGLRSVTRMRMVLMRLRVERNARRFLD